MDEAVGIGKAIRAAVESPVAAIGRIKRHVTEYVKEGGPVREVEDIELGKRFRLELARLKAFGQKLGRKRRKAKNPRRFLKNLNLALRSRRLAW